MQGKRIARELLTIEKMLLIYCRAKHQNADLLCNHCRALLEYAGQRLKYCRFGEQKPVCAKCAVHCYRPDMRAQVIEVMRFAGPRMLFRHPGLALLHWLDSRVKKPAGK